MTNEVENLILETREQNKIKYSENVAYLAYKEIWKFILYIYKYDFDKINIRFNVDKILGSYSINKTDGIKYEVIGNEINGTWNTYYEGAEHFYINNIFKTSIDIKLLFRLLEVDNFTKTYLDDENQMFVNLEITKYDIKKCINNILLKNRVLKLEK